MVLNVDTSDVLHHGLSVPTAAKDTPIEISEYANGMTTFIAGASQTYPGIYGSVFTLALDKGATSGRFFQFMLDRASGMHYRTAAGATDSWGPFQTVAASAVASESSLVARLAGVGVISTDVQDPGDPIETVDHMDTAAVIEHLLDRIEALEAHHP